MGQICILDLENENIKAISDDDYGKVFPKWSADSKFLSFQSLDGHVKIYDTQNKSLNDLGFGGDLRWSAKGSQYAYTQAEISNDSELISTRVVHAEAEGNVFYVSDRKLNAFQPYFDHDNVLYYYSNDRIVSSERKQSMFKSNNDLDNFQTLPISFAYEASSADTTLPVPYIHQVYDTPGERGYSSCAPTTAAMILGYYNILPKWPFVSGWGNTSQYGAYVHEKYRYRSTTYDLLHTDCNSSGSYCYSEYGGMGFMWSGGSPNSKMLNYYERHGMTGNQTWSTNWTTVANEIDKKKPYSICNYLSGSGHLVAAIGRASNGQRTVIVNDPYGDRNRSSYPNYYGKKVYYDWPGYNHGHASLNYAKSSVSSMPWCIATSYKYPTFVDSIIDDRQFENGFYIKAEGKTVPMRYYNSVNSGHNGHSWWTYTESDNNDVCYVSWTPNLDSSAYYEVFAYTPAYATATSAQYKVHHAAGETRVIIDQTANPDNWISLGKYLLRNDGSDYVYLGDSTGTGSQKLVFDEIKWRPAEVQSLNFTSDYTNGYPSFEVKFWVDSPISEGHYEYTWDFGDGMSGNGDTVIHCYADTGSYDVKLLAQTGGIKYEKIKDSYMHIGENVGNMDLINPKSFSVVHTSKPVLSWSINLAKSSDSPRYLVYLSLSPEFSDTLEHDSVLNEYSYQIINDLPENRNIYWKVGNAPSYDVSRNDVSSVPLASYYNSPVGVFTVNAQNSIPIDFELLSPEEMFVADTLRPRFSWAASDDKDPGDSLIYKLYIGLSKDEMNCVYSGSELTYSLQNDLVENGVYTWYVEAVDQFSAIKRSNEERKIGINTYNEAPSKVRQLSPAHNSYQTTRYPYIEWTESIDPDPGDEVTYKVYYWYEGSSLKYINEDTTYHDHRRFTDQRAYFWTVAAIDQDELYTYSDTLTVYIDSKLDIVDMPQSYALKGNYPNPFNPVTTIEYAIPSNEMVEINLYELSGKFVKNLRKGIHQPGHYSLRFDASELSSGIYIYKLSAGEFSASSKMLLLK
mgnify:CR=1 FL=1